MITQEDLDLAQKAQDATRKIISEYPDADSKTLESYSMSEIGEMPMMKIGLVVNEVNVVIREHLKSQKRAY